MLVKKSCGLFCLFIAAFRILSRDAASGAPFLAPSLKKTTSIENVKRPACRYVIYDSSILKLCYDHIFFFNQLKHLIPIFPIAKLSAPFL